MFMIQRLPDGLSFTRLTMTQENRRFKQCCHAFAFSFLNDSFRHYSVLMEEAMDGILKKKKKISFLLYRVCVCPPWWLCCSFTSLLAHLLSGPTHHLP